jgi:hypothetical protein
MKESLLHSGTFSKNNAIVAIFCLLIDILPGCGDASVSKARIAVYLKDKRIVLNTRNNPSPYLQFPTDIENIAVILSVPVV